MKKVKQKPQRFNHPFEDLISDEIFNNANLTYCPHCYKEVKVLATETGLQLTKKTTQAQSQNCQLQDLQGASESHFSQKNLSRNTDSKADNQNHQVTQNKQDFTTQYNKFFDESLKRLKKPQFESNEGLFKRIQQKMQKMAVNNSIKKKSKKEYQDQLKVLMNDESEVKIENKPLQNTMKKKKIQIKSAVKKFICRLCKCILTGQNYVKHLKNEHNIRPTPIFYLCPFCNLKIDMDQKQQHSRNCRKKAREINRAKRFYQIRTQERRRRKEFFRRLNNEYDNGSDLYRPGWQDKIQREQIDKLLGNDIVRGREDYRQPRDMGKEQRTRNSHKQKNSQTYMERMLKNFQRDNDEDPEAVFLSEEQESGAQQGREQASGRERIGTGVREVHNVDQ